MATAKLLLIKNNQIIKMSAERELIPELTTGVDAWIVEFVTANGQSEGIRSSEAVPGVTSTEEAAQKLLEKYAPKPEPKPEPKPAPKPEPKVRKAPRED